MLEIVASLGVIAALAVIGVNCRALMADRDSRDGATALLLMGGGALVALGLVALRLQAWAGVWIAVGGTAALALGALPLPQLVASRRSRTTPAPAAATPDADADVIPLRRAA